MESWWLARLGKTLNWATEVGNSVTQIRCAGSSTLVCFKRQGGGSMRRETKSSSRRVPPPQSQTRSHRNCGFFLHLRSFNSVESAFGAIEMLGIWSTEVLSLIPRNHEDTDFTGKKIQLTLIWQSHLLFLRDLFPLLFLDMDHLKSLYWICYNIVSVLSFGFLVVRHVGS